MLNCIEPHQTQPPLSPRLREGGEELKMNMVFVGTYFKKVDLITIGYTQARLFDYQIYFLVDNDSSVLGRAD